jgi:hypothetical protein
MNKRPYLWMAALVAILLAAPAIVHGQEIVQFRTGQVGGVPGTCPNPDDIFKYNPISIPPCPQAFRTAPFTAADFSAAAGGPPAKVITPYSAYLPTLPSDPLARWINWQPGQNCFAGIPNSALYACRFNVRTTCNPVGTIRICWAVDDVLGDPAGGGPNPIGIYLNGVALNPGFSGGNYANETCFIQTNVPLNTGANTLYVYQRDLGCSISGLILSATVSVNSTTCPGLSVLKFNDLNGDGVQQSGEPGMPGWQINISGPVNQSLPTDANGYAYFHCIPAGTYQITEVNQPGWINTFPIGGVQTMTLDCGLEYIAYVGNRRCEGTGQGNCVPLPSCLTAWWPFNECAGTIANEVVANRDGTIIGGSGNPTWGAGRPGSPCGLRIPGSPGTQVVTMADAPEHDFGTGSFTIFAWVKTLSNDGSIKTIVDKRDPPFLTPTGYALYHTSGVLKFQYNDGIGAVTNHVSTAPAFNDGNWHTVAVSVCRDPNNPINNVTRLFVDNYVDTFTGPSIPTGSLSNNAGLQFGDQCPGFIVGIPFDGAIDDVMLFKCCLTPQQIAALRTDLQYCAETCSVPTIRSTPFGTTTTVLTLCNNSPTAQSYSWSIAGLPAQPGCSVNGPTIYSPASGTVTLPPGPSCTNIPITINLPSGMLPGQTTCYQVSTLNLATGRCCVTKGRIRKTWIWHVNSDPSFYQTQKDIPVSVHFTVGNDTDQAQPFQCRLVGRSNDGDDLNRVVSLNGLPPGEPVFQSIMIPPMDSVTVTIEATLLEFQPLNLNEVVLEADSDGDGTMEDVACATIESVPELTAADAQEITPPLVAPVLRDELTVFPNPFHGQTGIRLALSKPQTSVRIEIYDVSGRLVRSLFSGTLGAGSNQFSWNGRDDQGRAGSQGLYFVRIHAGDVALQTKMLRLE